MNSLLVVNSSGRITRSVTRKLTERFVAGWKLRIPNGEIITRDVSLNPPPPVVLGAPMYNFRHAGAIQGVL
jgi:FMN-dependent NADH-azoreductase